MTNKKISALTGAATPLTGTELVPVVQSSATTNVSVSNLQLGTATEITTSQAYIPAWTANNHNIALIGRYYTLSA